MLLFSLFLCCGRRHCRYANACACSTFFFCCEHSLKVALFISVVFVVAIFSSDFFPSLHILGFEAEVRAYLLPVIP